MLAGSGRVWLGFKGLRGRYMLILFIPYDFDSVWFKDLVGTWLSQPMEP